MIRGFNPTVVADFWTEGIPTGAFRKKIGGPSQLSPELPVIVGRVTSLGPVADPDGTIVAVTQTNPRRREGLERELPSIMRRSGS
jgi:hypothetical protein